MVSYDVIIRPIITERSMAGAADKKYVFEVAPGAGKIEIRKAVEEIFSVKVAKVNTMIVPGRPSSSSRVWCKEEVNHD